MATRNKLSDRELANDKAKRIMNGVDAWCSFYRANPHRFCLDYLNIKLIPSAVTIRKNAARSISEEQKRKATAALAKYRAEK